MSLGQKQTGETVNAAISLSPTTGQFVFSFSNPFNMLIGLNNSTGVIINGGTLNDRFNLLNGSASIINGGKGNNIFNVSATAGTLNDNILHGGGAMDFVTLNGSNTQIDLTQGSSGVEAVVGRKSFSGEAVSIGLNQLASSALTDGANGRAFAAVIGATGQVSVKQTGKFQFVGVVDSADHGFSATGDAITGDALTALLGSVTQITGIKGNLASMYAGSSTGAVPANETHIANDLSAYVFSDGTKSYTIWSDGVVTPTDPKDNVLPALFHPGSATPAQPVSYDAVSVFNTSEDWAGATLTTDSAGQPSLTLNPGNTSAHSAIVLRAGATGVTVHGDSGLNGPNWFGLGQSSGSNHIFGSKGGSVFDLQSSTSLQDILTGGAGFDIVRASSQGADVDLTANNGTTGLAATGIEAAVGSANLLNLQTVELDVGKIKFTPDATGAKIGVFEALLGSTDDMLSLSGSGKWMEVATFAPGTPAPEHASALVNADQLNDAFGSHSHTAENSLTGHLFEQVDAHGAALKYLTVYTDATVVNLLLPPAQTFQIPHDTIF